MDPVVADNPVAGDHIYVDAPPAVRDVDVPTQIEGPAGLTVIVGSGFIVTVILYVLEQLFTSVPVTV